MIDLAKARQSLNEMQLLKLSTAAKILKNTASIFAELSMHPSKSSLLPLWAAGVITHGQPNTRFFEVGITQAALDATPRDRTKDHLFRVTATAELILSKATDLSEAEIEDLLLARSLKMVTTRQENHSTLKKALKSCLNKDDWQELYMRAGVKYQLHQAPP